MFIVYFVCDVSCCEIVRFAWIWKSRGHLSDAQGKQQIEKLIRVFPI